MVLGLCMTISKSDLNGSGTDCGRSRPLLLYMTYRSNDILIWILHLAPLIYNKLC